MAWQSGTDPVSTQKIPVFKEELTSKLRPDLAERISIRDLNSMASKHNSESFMLDWSTTKSVVVAIDATNLTVLNYDGVDKHANIKYCPGMQIPLFSIRSPNLVERLSKVGLDRVKVKPALYTAKTFGAK